MNYNWNAHQRGYNHAYAGPHDPNSRPRPPSDEGREEYMAGWKDGMNASRVRKEDRRVVEVSEPIVISA